MTRETGGSAVATESPASESPAGGERQVDEPRSARREATRRRILEAARVVFAEKGVFGATIEDICEQAGFTRGAVYSNFADKDDILRAVIESEHQALLDHLTDSFAMVDAEMQAAVSLDEAVATLVRRILRSIPIGREVSLITTELEILAVRRPEVGAMFLSGHRAFRARLAEVLVLAMARIGREPVVDALDIIDAVMAISERSFRTALIDGPDADPYRLSEAVLPRILLVLSKPLGTTATTSAREPLAGTATTLEP